MRLSKDTILTYLVAVILALAAGFGGGYLGFVIGQSRAVADMIGMQPIVLRGQKCM